MADAPETGTRQPTCEPVHLSLSSGTMGHPFIVLSSPGATSIQVFTLSLFMASPTIPDLSHTAIQFSRHYGSSGEIQTIGYKAPCSKLVFDSCSQPPATQGSPQIL